MMFHRQLIARSLATLVFSCLMTLSVAAIDVVVMQNDLIQFTEQAFIQNVFGNHRTYTAAREHSEKTLQVQIEYIEDAVQLSDEQRGKLELAGHGDIHRFFTDFESVKRGMEFGGIPRDEWQQVWQRTQPLATRFAAGLHGPRSLLTKSVASTLAPEQQERFDAMKRERDVAIYTDNIRMTLSLIDRKVPLTRQQRETITQMLVRTTAPPEYYGQASMHFYVVLIQMADLPRAQFKAVFNESEWKIIDGLLRQAKAMQRTLELQQEALGQ
jgi:hypothetical protein